MKRRFENRITNIGRAADCRSGLAWIATCLLALPSVGTLAAEAPAGVGYDQPKSETSESSPHHVGVFVGGASRYQAPADEEEETGLAVGVEYEYRFAKHWGTGLLIEGVTTDHARDGILVVPLNFHPWEWLKLSVAPGVEFVEKGEEEFVVRIGAAYEVELGHWFLGPEVSLDVTRESQTLVYGLSFGRRF